MKSMFCYQCEQTARGVGCTLFGVCGKTPDVSYEQDVLTCEMIALACIMQEKAVNHIAYVDLIYDGLFTTITNVSFDAARIVELSNEIKSIRKSMGGKATILPQALFQGEPNTCSLRSTLLFGLRGMAAYACHARSLGRRNPEVDAWLIKGMAALAQAHSVEVWLSLLMEFGAINLQCMALLDQANTESYGNPTPVSVPLEIETGPFIVVTGHDLHDLKMLLEQTDGKGVNIYTHSEMLPAHGYPELKKHAQLKGNFGTAWHNQQREFQQIPAPVLYTTNCLMPVRESYSDKVYTTSVVAYPGMKHIQADDQGHKDFSALIDHAITLGGYTQPMPLTGINGGTHVTTGFGRHTILNQAPAIIDAIKKGAIRHFFLIGGCDSANPERHYYTQFAKETPPDTMILTLACGKYRINDLDMGHIGSLPRILDMGQCNDAYGAIQVALALANAFNCEVNDLPLTLVLSWFEQKAVCILLTLFSLGIKNIYLGPTVPAFLSEDVLQVLTETFHLKTIQSPQEDLQRMLGN